MRSVQVSKPKGPLEIVEKDIPEPGTREVRIKVQAWSNVTINYALYGMQQLARNNTGIQVPLSGHWIPEEQPDFVVDQLFKFFGNSTK